jgi:class 3 adenylate cyclase/tetratricopeptide (TPR) repeat protein
MDPEGSKGASPMEPSCTGCGEAIRPDTAFCIHCGTPLDRACGECGAAAPTEARFCGACGAAMPTVEPAERGDRSAARPSPGTGSRASSVPAERRPVTVLFADATGSTQLVERIGDEAAYRLVQDCVARMSASVDRHGGTVTQFRGDGIMALFGAPLAHEDSAVHAVLAALEMQAALRDYGAEVEDRLGEPCRFRIGLNTGPVVVGSVGDDVLLDYTAIGDTANVAARMEQAAPPGGVLLAEPTWRAVRDYVECEPVGPLEVRGKATPIDAFEARRPTGLRSRMDASLARGLSPFVGRTDELGLLEGFLRRLSDRQGRVVLVTGEAGIGKSRLLHELRGRLPAGVDWFEGECSASGQRTHLLPIADLLRRAFDVDEGDDTVEIAERVEGAAAGWSREARAAVPYLKWVLRAGGQELEDLDPRERRAGVFEALRTAMLDAASRRPIVVTIEDLHWADEASEAAVAALAESVADHPVLLLVTARPGHATPLDGNPSVVRLALDQLGGDETAALAAGVLGVSALPEELRHVIAKRAEGNPLFVEEVTASLVETGALVREGDGYRLAVDPVTVTIPETLHEVILARVDRLDRSAREALQLAAVIGREFTRRLLDRIAQLPDALDDDLRQLQSLELIRQKSYFPELAFLFKHALTHDVTYSTLLEERRRALHRLVAETVEELYRDRLAEHCETLARHWLEAGDDARALGHLEMSADRAMAGFAVPSALAAYDRAIQIAERLGDTERVMSLAEQRGLASATIGDLRTAIDSFDRVAATARSLGNADREALGLARRAYSELFSRDYETAEATVREALAISGSGVVDGQGTALTVLRVLLLVLDRHDEVAAVEQRMAPLWPQISDQVRAEWAGVAALHDNWRGRWGDLGPLAEFARGTRGALIDRQTLTWNVGLSAAGRGDYGLALEMLRLAVDRGLRAGEVLGHARSLNTLGWVHGDLADHEGAIAWNRRCLDFVAPLDLPDPEIEANARLNVADCWLALGRLDEAAAELEWVRRAVDDPGSDPWMMWRYRQHFLHSTGELCLRRADPEGALRHAEACLAAALRSASTKNVVKARRLRGQAFAALGRTDEAVGSLEEALAVARELGNPPQLWRTLLAVAELASSRGDEGDARQAAMEARSVIDRVAASVPDDTLRATLLGSAEAAAVDALA